MFFPIPYPCNGGIPCLPTYVQVTSRKSIRLLFTYRFTAAPVLCNASTKLTSLTHRFYMLYLIILEYKKTSIRKKDEELVVPPLLAEKTAHFGNMKWVFHIISGNDETVRQSLL